MADEPAATPEPQYITKEELDASVSDITDKISELGEKLETPAAEEDLPPESPQDTPVADGKAPWETDPNWRPNSYGELAQAVENYLVKQGFSKANADEIAQGVQEKLATKQQKEKAENDKLMSEAQERINKEVAEAKKENADLDEKKVFEFIADWNEKHKDSPIRSFNAGLDIFNSQQRKKEESGEEPPKPRLPGGSTGTEGDDKKKPRFRSVDDALAVALSKFEQE